MFSGDFFAVPLINSLNLVHDVENNYQNSLKLNLCLLFYSRRSGRLPANGLTLCRCMKNSFKKTGQLKEILNAVGVSIMGTLGRFVWG